MASTASPLVLSAKDRDGLHAIEQLVGNGQSAISELLGHLSEKSWAIRRAVIGSLARLGDPAIVGLCHVLTHERGDEARLASAVEALVASTGDTDSHLLPLLDASDPAVVCDAIAVLGRRHSRGSITALERLTAHEDANVALAAIDALGRIGGDAGVETLIQTVRARDFFRTFPALEALGKSRDPRAKDLLIDLLDEPLYAANAAQTLADSGDPAIAVPLLAALQRGDEALVRACAQALRTLEPSLRAADWAALRAFPNAATTVARVQEAWQRASFDERAALALVLGAAGQSEGVQALLLYLRADADLAEAIQRALRRAGRDADASMLAVIETAGSTQRKTLLPLIGSAPRGSPTLAAALADPDASVRAAAADALARVGDVSTVPALFGLLADSNPQVMQATLSAIQALGCNETESLALAAAAAADPRTRRAGLRILSYFGYASGLEALVRATTDGDERTREAALAGIAFLDDPRAVNALLAATEHASAKTRAAAVRALSHLSLDENVTGIIARCLRDPDAWVRYYACLSAGRLKVTTLVDDLITLVADPAGQVQVAAIEALSHMRAKPAQAALITAARSQDGDLSRAAIVALGSLGGRDAISVLLSHVSSQDSAARMMAITGVANYDGPEATQVLRRAAFDEDPSVRAAAIGLLAARDDPQASEALIALLEDPIVGDKAAAALASREHHLPQVSLAFDGADRHRCDALAAVLVRMRRADAEAALLSALESSNVCARRAAASALASLRSPAVARALRKATTEDSDAEVRARAVTSLR